MEYVLVVGVLVIVLQNDLVSVYVISLGMVKNVLKNLLTLQVLVKKWVIADVVEVIYLPMNIGSKNILTTLSFLELII